MNDYLNGRVTLRDHIITQPEDDLCDLTEGKFLKVLILQNSLKPQKLSKKINASQVSMLDFL